MALHFVQLSKGTVQKLKSVELVKEPVVLDLMRAVHLKLLSVQNGVIVSVPLINLVDLNVDLDSIIMLIQNQMIMKMITMLIQRKIIKMIPKQLLTMTSMRYLIQIRIRDPMKMK